MNIRGCAGPYQLVLRSRCHMAAVLYPQIVDATIFRFLSMVDGVGWCLSKVGTAQGRPVIAVAVVFVCV
jgi:hypothetical protein